MIKSSERQGSKSGMPWLFSFFFAIVLQLNRCCPTIRKRISESVVSNICRKSTFFFFSDAEERVPISGRETSMY